MGLNCSHGAFDGAYSAFNRFRQIVMKAAGGSWPPHEDKSLSNSKFYWGEGYCEESHPGLAIFFSQSDCDGEISPGDCLLVVNDLEQLLDKIKDLDTESWGHIEKQGGFYAVTKRFIDGCKRAHGLNEPLLFL